MTSSLSRRVFPTLAAGFLAAPLEAIDLRASDLDVHCPTMLSQTPLSESPSVLSVGRWSGSDRVIMVTYGAALEFHDLQSGDIVAPSIPLATATYLSRHPIERATFSKDGRHVAAFFAPNRLRCFDTASGLLRWEVLLNEQITALTFDVHPERVVVAGIGKRLLAFDPDTGADAGSVDLHRQVNSLTSLGDGAFEARFQGPGFVTVGSVYLPIRARQAPY